MCQDEEIASIRYGFHAIDLLPDWDNPNRYDLKKSAQAYADLCRHALEEQYPGVEIEIRFDTDVSGALASFMDTQVNGRTDSYEVDAVEHLCSAVYQEYKWVVNRPWLRSAEARKRFGIPVPTIRWVCQKGLVAEAERKAGWWEFPLEAFAEVGKKIAFIDFKRESNASIMDGDECVLQCHLNDTQYVRAVDFPNVQIIVIAPDGFGIPLFNGDNSNVLVSKHAAKIELVLEHFIDEVPWTGVQWSYDTYARTLVSQARQYAFIESEWLESEYDGKTFIEAVQFKFTNDGLLPCTLRELIDQAIGVLGSIIQETEVCLSGGFVWQREYKEDERIFCTEVLAPLLRKMGFESVRYTHGTREYGKDFTFSELTKFGEWRHYGLQAKVGNVSGGVNSEIDEILGQIQDAFEMPYRELGSRANRYISDFIVAISGHFTENAQEKICEKMPLDVRGSVHFWDKQTILGLIDKYWADG